MLILILYIPKYIWELIKFSSIVNFHKHIPDCYTGLIKYYTYH